MAANRAFLLRPAFTAITWVRFPSWTPNIFDRAAKHVEASARAISLSLKKQFEFVTNGRMVSASGTGVGQTAVFRGISKQNNGTITTTNT